MKKQTHAGKLVAPVVISILVLAQLSAWVALCTLVPGLPVWGKAAAGVIALALCGVEIFVLLERIKEVRSGEEDDLGQY